MSDSYEVVLDAATSSDAAVLSNLLELYSHDLSDVFALELGANGRFGYQELPLYWSDSDRRFPFLIHVGTRLAGLALVTRGSLHPTIPTISISPSSSLCVGIVAPGWAAEQPFCSGIGLPVVGPSACRKGTKMVCGSGQVS